MIVIDGSPDNSISVAQALRNEFPTCIKIIDKENGGHGSTINIGLKQANGKYIRVLDSDDWFDLDSFIEFLERLRSETSDLVMTNLTYEMIYEKRTHGAKLS